AKKITKTLQELNLRTVIDTRSEPLSAKIKTAQIEKTPWMLVVGQKEMDNNTITLRHVTGKQEFGLTIEEIINKAQQANSIKQI
ncbi:MAG: threonine--tRNA ligase, partial [Epsilonproteobacteria bacterium]|nr:threonine--tRNA ligase [Campylobacterota bacterium]